MGQYEQKEDFLETLRVQLSCKKARNFVCEEINQHIEDQKNAYIAEGNNDKTAMTLALEQMGDPVNVGKQLDKIHRPRMEWSILIAVLTLCCLGILAQLSLGNMIHSMNSPLPNSVNVNRHIIFLIIGVLTMAAVYFTDYSLIGKYSKAICLLFWAGFFLFGLIDERFNNHFRYLYPYGLLFIPIFSSILFAYRKKGYIGLLKCLFLCIATLLLEKHFIVQSSVYMGVLLSCLILLTITVMKNWFGTSRKISLTIIWGVIPLFYGILSLLKVSILNVYQLVRLENTIKSLFQIGIYDGDYQMNRAIQIISNAKLFGRSNILSEEYLPGYNTEYILTYIIGRWGLAAGILIISLFIAILGRMFYLAYHQKNSLGMLTGLGCSLVFAVQGIIYILSNFGFQIVAQINLPFVSYGGSSLLVNFAVLGLMLSIFRNTNIMKEVPYTGKLPLRIEKVK